jgi:hypothetical protein
MIEGMHSSGIRRVDDLFAEGMLHPEMARTLLAKVPQNAFGKSVVNNALKQLRAVSAQSAANAIFGGQNQ